MKRFGFIIYLLISALIVSSCASTGFLMAKAKVTLFEDAYPQKSEDEKIDIYITNKPTQDYLEFAQITCRDPNDKWSLEQIIMKARKIGADGIIIIEKAESQGIGLQMGNITYLVSDAYGMTAVAIKYK